MAISRRKFLHYPVLAASAAVSPLLLPRAARAAYFYKATDFVAPLAIPPQYRGQVKNAKRHFDLFLQKGTTEFFKGYSTPTMGINGSYLGPVLRLNRGDVASFRVANTLDQPSTLHWHGAILPARMDGGPHQIIPPGQIWQPEFSIVQPASTLWYHSHLHRYTGAQVYQGLGGLIYIDDDNNQKVDLPLEYGIDDIPLVIQDRNFYADGKFQYLSNMHERMAGMRGNHILINGVVRPWLNITRKQIRFRLLNAANARIYNLRFSDNRHFLQIASDGGLLEKTVKLQQLRLSPGERAEIVVEFGQNDDVMLQHEPLPIANRPRGMMAMMTGNDRAFQLMRLSSKNPGGDVIKLLPELARIPIEKGTDITRTRHFQLDMSMGMGMMSGSGGFTINRRSFDLQRIDEIMRLNDTEIWEFTNNSPMPHPIHIHNIQFRILSRNGRAAPENERGYKDTALVHPAETVRLQVKFEHYADETTPYMYHCHILEHEDLGMMGQFVVVP